MRNHGKTYRQKACGTADQSRAHRKVIRTGCSVRWQGRGAARRPAAFLSSAQNRSRDWRDMAYTENEQKTLSELLAQDRESVMTRLSTDRAQDRALKTLESEADRLMYKAGAAEGSGERGEVVQGMLQVAKSALGLIESVSEAEIWEKPEAKKTGTVYFGPVVLICAIAGAACVAGGLIGQSIAGKILRPGAILWAVAGCLLLLIGGYLAGRGPKEKDSRKHRKETKQTFLIDPDKVWHILQGVTLSADHSLERIQEYEQLRQSQAEGNSQTASPMPKDELQFFCDLLENAYARRRSNPQDEALREQVESIRYYLHSKGIETEDYSLQSASWFELLPAGGGAVTIRPALLRDGAVIRKGLASA